MNFKISLSLLLVGLGAGCGAPSPEDPGAEVSARSAALSVSYLPDRDTWAFPVDGGGRDFGVSRELRTNNILNAQPPNFIFLRFPVDLAAVCPTLNVALLRLTSAQRPGPLYVAAHPVLAPWAPGNTGAAAAMGCAANSGMSAPFNIPAFGAPVAQVLVNQACTEYTWNITPIVQGWCNGAPNRGVMLGGRVLNNVANFFSMENPIKRPHLDISY